MKFILMRIIFLSLLFPQHSRELNTYSLGDNFGYTEWQTGGPEEPGEELFCPDNSIAVG